MKKVIYFLGILFLSIVVILNLIFTAYLDKNEHITINFNSFIYVIGLILIGLLIFFCTRAINEHLYNEQGRALYKTKKFWLIIAISVYIIFNIVWIIAVRTPVIGDSGHVCDLATIFYKGDFAELSKRMSYAGTSLADYMQAYHQQIPISFIVSIIYKIAHTDSIITLRILNIIYNMLIVFALYKISKQLKYKTNSVLLFTLILTFITIPMLSTFIYGDIPSLAFCLLSVYYIMKYTESRKVKYAVISSIFIMIAYMFRMNSLIFIIATIMYLVLNLFKNITQKCYKENLLNMLIIVVYIAISIIPSSLIKNYYLEKSNLEKNKETPNASYFLMAMEEGPRSKGWYNEEIAEYALKNNEIAKNEYVGKIKERLNYFSKNIGYTFNFYVTKIASMWTENTYSAVRNNTVEGKAFEELINPITFYQKVLLLIICICSIIVLIQNRKNLSTELLFLLTIFIGGFAFHILWEAKSRYIIPYIVVLIPIASIYINFLGLSHKI